MLGLGRERLDLMAIDKDGNLVIIENRLDDSGRDMVRRAQSGPLEKIKKGLKNTNLNKELAQDAE